MTSTLGFNLGNVRLRAEKRREFQNSAVMELKANRVTESRLTRRAFSRWQD